MSGTSLDGIDAVLVDFNQQGKIIEYASLHFDDDLKTLLLQLQKPIDNEIHLSQLASTNLSVHYAKAVDFLLKKANLNANDIIAIGSHGQTIRHQPQKNDLKNSYTIQIQNPSLLAELTGIDTISNFREADIAAGGQGAPLVPAFHADYFKYLLNKYAQIIVCNIGGMSNITILKQDNPVLGMDCGAGNVLCDAWIKHNLNQDFDADGSWARAGTINNNLLEIMLRDEYFKQQLPKSTGRERFNLDFVLNAVAELGSLELVKCSASDIQSTLVHFTASAIAQHTKKYGYLNNSSTNEKCLLAVCGGGARNSFLLECIQKYLPEYEVCTTTSLGLDAQHVEALAFAWLAKQYVEGKPSNLPDVTGASKYKVLGGLFKKS
jgi:anhydro-N-acetylmuramic acid kinase